MKKFFNLCWSIILLILLSACAFGEETTDSDPSEGTMVDDLVFSNRVYLVEQATNVFIQKWPYTYYLNSTNVPYVIYPFERTNFYGLGISYGSPGVTLGLHSEGNTGLFTPNNYLFIRNAGDTYLVSKNKFDIQTPLTIASGDIKANSFTLGNETITNWSSLSTLPFDLIVTEPVGQYNSGDKIDIGTPFSTIFKNMLRKILTPVDPAFSVSPSNFTADLIEYGTQIPNNSTITLTYEKNDGGNVTNFSWKLNNTQISSTDEFSNPLTGVASYFNTRLQTASIPITASFIVKYEDGPELEEDYQPRILPGGTLSDQFILTPARYRYYAPLTVKNYNITDVNIKALESKPNGGKKLIASNTGSFTINCPVGTAEVVFALPLFFVSSRINNLKVVFKANDLQVSRDITSEIIHQTIDITPETGASSTIANFDKYEVMVFRPTAAALSGAATLTITY